MSALYYVQTTVMKYEGYWHVTFSWLRCGQTDRPYQDLIENYDPLDPNVDYPRQAIDEMFSESEANLLKQYLDRCHSGDFPLPVTRIDKVELPIKMNQGAMGALAVGGLTDFYMLHRRPNYDLPFKVEGYFDLRGCEPVGEARIIRAFEIFGGPSDGGGDYGVLLEDYETNSDMVAPAQFFATEEEARAFVAEHRSEKQQE